MTHSTAFGSEVGKILLLTPRTPEGDRVHLRVSRSDYQKARRGRRWQATVTNLWTGTRWRLRGASCGLPGCYCDAVGEAL